MMCLAFSDGHCGAAARWCRVSLRSMASRLSDFPVRVGEIGSVGLLDDPAIQSRRVLMVGFGQRCERSLRPLPRQATCAPAPRWMSLRRSPISSKTRSPVWDHEQHECPISPSGPGRRVRCHEQGVDLGGSEVGDQGSVEAFGRHGQDSADGGGVLGVAWRGEVEQILGVWPVCEPRSSQRVQSQPLGGLGSLPYEFFSASDPSRLRIVCSTFRACAICGRWPVAPIWSRRCVRPDYYPPPSISKRRLRSMC